MNLGDHKPAAGEGPTPAQPASPPEPPHVSAVADETLRASISAFAQIPAAITVSADGYRTVLHRGVPVATFDPEVPAGPERRATDRTLPFDAVEAAVDEILRLELKCAARSVGQITEQDILRDLARDALNALDFTEVIDLYRLTTQDVGPSPIGRLRTITGGSLRTERLAKALAAKTIESLGVDVLRDAFATRRDRRKSDPNTQRRRREHEQAPPGPTGS